MMEPIFISWLAAQAIAKIALDKFVEGGAGELGKKLTEPVSRKVQELGNTVGKRIRSSAAVAAVVEGAAQDNPKDVQRLKDYLYSRWTKEQEFAAEVKKMADEIHVELKTESDSSLSQSHTSDIGILTNTGKVIGSIPASGGIAIGDNSGTINFH